MSINKMEFHAFKASYHLKYQKKIHELINNRPWYLKIADYLFGLDEPLKKHQVLINDSITSKKGVCASLQEIKQDLEHYSQRLNFFTRWLTGIKSLIRYYTKLIEKAMNERNNYIHQMDMNSRVSEHKKTVSFDNDSQKKLNDHLEHKQNYLNNLPKIERKPMPYIFEIFGRKRDIIAAPCINAGKPMNYKNLKKELKATNAAIESARNEMIRKRENALQYNFAMIQAGLFHVNPYPADDPGEKEDKQVDAGFCAQAYLEKQLKTLQFQSPSISIGKDNMDNPVIRLS